eukprot:13692894-Alexandrium_andersonii.AAC.1
MLESTPLTGRKSDRRQEYGCTGRYCPWLHASASMSLHQCARSEMTGPGSRTWKQQLFMSTCSHE